MDSFGFPLTPQSHLHPGVDVHQPAPGDRLHDAVVVADHLLQLWVSGAVGAAEHQGADHVGDGPGDGGRRVEAPRPVRQQLHAETVHCRQNCTDVYVTVAAGV